MLPSKSAPPVLSTRSSALHSVLLHRWCVARKYSKKYLFAPPIAQLSKNGWVDRGALPYLPLFAWASTEAAQGGWKCLLYPGGGRRSCLLLRRRQESDLPQQHAVLLVTHH